jgi:hypothetical protein
MTEGSETGLNGSTIYETSGGRYEYTVEQFETHYEVRRHIEYEGYQHYVFRTIEEAITGLENIVNQHTDYYTFSIETSEVIRLIREHGE